MNSYLLVVMVVMVVVVVMVMVVVVDTMDNKFHLLYNKFRLYRTENSPLLYIYRQ